VPRLLRRYFHVGDPTWTVRRRMAIWTMSFCCFVILVCLCGPFDKELSKTAISSAFVLLGAVPSMYSLATVADDHSKRVTAAEPAAKGEGG